MSIADNIQKIARTAELKRKIDELQDLQTQSKDKAIIKSSSSVANTNKNSGNPGLSSGDDRQDTAVDVKAGAGAGGATSSNGYTGNMKSLFDDTPEVGAKLESLGGFVDCATGEEAKINLDGKYDPEIIEGIDNEGTWSGESSVDPRNYSDAPGGGWEKGFQWQGQQMGYVAPFSTSAGGAAELGVAGITSPFAGLNGPFSQTIGEETSPNVFQVNITGSDGSTTATVSRSGCVVGSSTACPVDLESAIPYVWSSDAIQNIAFDGAQFKTSAQEPADDKNNKWDNNPSKLSGCDSDGNAVDLTPTGNGGVSIDYSDGKHIEQKDGIITAVSGY